MSPCRSVTRNSVPRARVSCSTPPAEANVSSVPSAFGGDSPAALGIWDLPGGDGGVVRNDALPVTPRASLGELGTEEENLGGVVDPGDEDDERTCRPVRRTHAGPAEVKADERLADREEHGSKESAVPDVAPPDARIRDHLEDEGEEKRDRRDGDDDVDALPEASAAGQPVRHELAGDIEAGADDQ